MSPYRRRFDLSLYLVTDGVGPVFATPTKADADPAMGLEGLAATRAATRLPIVAIGGIDLASASAVIRAGADGVAVVSAICAAPDPRRAAAELAGAVATARGQPWGDRTPSDKR